MKPIQHFLTGEELTPAQINALLQQALVLKKERNNGELKAYLPGQHLALLFDKPSTRTRFSFTVAMRELGGDTIESTADTRKSEEPEDQARVLAGYCKGIMIRTFEDSHIQRMSQSSPIPVINGLSNLHHPCQTLADLLTLLEKFGTLTGLTVTYIGDGNNILHSLLLLAPELGVNVHYCCPTTRQPNAGIVAAAKAKLSANTGHIQTFTQPQEAVKNTHAVYTDVWTSMGFDKVDESLFDGFQVNEALMAQAAKDAIFLHCMPMVRGQEVSHTLPDQSCSAIFQQSENRLHAQKALLLHLLK